MKLIRFVLQMPDNEANRQAMLSVVVYTKRLPSPLFGQCVMKREDIDLVGLEMTQPLQDWDYQI